MYFMNKIKRNNIFEISRRRTQNESSLMNIILIQPLSGIIRAIRSRRINPQAFLTINQAKYMK